MSDYNDQNIGFEQLGGKELSYNNYNDIFAALEVLLSIKKKAATVIIKHANPCGVAVNKSPLQSFKNAYISDPISAFGGVIACNFKIDKKIAEEINKNFPNYNEKFSVLIKIKTKLDKILEKKIEEETAKLIQEKGALKSIQTYNRSLEAFKRENIFNGSNNIDSVKVKINIINGTI